MKNLKYVRIIFKPKLKRTKVSLNKFTSSMIILQQLKSLKKKLIERSVTRLQKIWKMQQRDLLRNVHPNKPRRKS
jgi:hypothetical protein